MQEVGLMAARYDAIVVGGGHNGVVAAAYLARSGARTLVLEARGKTGGAATDRKSTRLNSSHPSISYAVFCLKKKISGKEACDGLTRTVRPQRRSDRLLERGRRRDLGGAARPAGRPDRAPRRAGAFFFNDAATPEIYTLSLHDALPICLLSAGQQFGRVPDLVAAADRGQ